MSNARPRISVDCDVFEIPGMIHALSIAKTTARMCNSPRLEAMFDRQLNELYQIFPRDLAYLFDDEVWVRIGLASKHCSRWSVFPKTNGAFSDMLRVAVQFDYEISDSVTLQSDWSSKRNFDDPVYSQVKALIEPWMPIDAQYYEIVTDAERWWRRQKERENERDQDGR